MNKRRIKAVSTFSWVAIAASAMTVQPIHATDIPSLPQAITSFGACVADGQVYVYGGHTGEAHKYSVDTTTYEFLRIPLSGAEAWEKLPGPVRTQGASLIPWKGKLIRVSGLAAHNPTIDEDEHLVSLTDVAAFDPVTQAWEALPDLPAPRSSHDSVIVDGKLYVMGGWKLFGSRKGEWYDNAWVLDLNQTESGWTEIPQPFKRRAIAVDAVGNHIVVIGGMDSNGDTSREVDVFDIGTRTWSRGPKLPDGPMDGFGVAACVINGTLYASPFAGTIIAWSPGETEWKEVAQLAQKRFFHRIVPMSDTQILAIAGASRKEGHLNTVEVVEINPLVTTK